MVDENGNGGMHKRVDWMVPAHPAILEFMDSARDAYGNPAYVTPQVIAWNTSYGRKHISRELQTLIDKGLVEKEGRGKYRLAEKGVGLMSCELRPQELEDSDSG